MHVLLGPLLGVAAVAALQALAVAWLVGLVIAAVVVAAAPVLLAAIVVARDPRSHWLRRPLAFGAILGAGAVGAVALSLSLLGTGNELSFVRPFVPGLVALPIDLALLVVLAVRGARSARDAVRGADMGGGAKSLGRLAARALSRGVAIVVFGAALVLGTAEILAIGGERSLPVEVLVLDAVSVFVVFGLGSLFAWWGRVPRAAISPGPTR